MDHDAPYYGVDKKNKSHSSWIETDDHIKLRALRWQGGDRGTVFIFPGRTEYCEKYDHVADKLIQRGFTVYCIDWRGQGLSDKIEIDTNNGHIDNFENYQHDVAALMDLAKANNAPKPYIMLAHSMGGCIGLRTLLNDSSFSSAILTAPMWGVYLEKHEQILSSVILKFANILDIKKWSVPLTNQRHHFISHSFEDNLLTTDPVWFEKEKDTLLNFPDLELGPPTIGWLKAALEECAWLNKQPAPDISALILVGSDEHVVDIEMIKNYMHIWDDSVYHLYSGARHELLIEVPEIENQVWRDIDQFLTDT